MSGESKSRIVDALMAPPNALLDPASAKLLRKAAGEIAARKAIIRSIQNWTGHPVDERGRIPVVRDGRPIGYELNLLSSSFHPAFSLVSDPIKMVTMGVWAEDTKVLKDRVTEYGKVRAAILSSHEQLSGLAPESEWGIWDGNAPLNGELLDKVIFAIGYRDAFRASALGLVRDLDQAIERTQDELAKRPSKRGRPRNEARHLVAQRLASLFVYATGEKPTYSSGHDGYSGKFTRALDELFRAIGWDADLEGPARAAIEAVLPELDKQRINAEPRGILGGVLGLRHSP